MPANVWSLRLGTCLIASSVVLGFAFAHPQDDLQSKTRVTGTVRNRSSGKVISGASVSARSVNGRKSSTTKSDGTYAIEQLTPGRYFIFARRETPRLESVSKWIVISGEKEITVDFSMEDAAAVTGKLVDAEKHPMAGISVNALERRYAGTSDSYLAMASGVSDDLGTFRLDGLIPGRQYIFVAGDRRKEIIVDGEKPQHPIQPVLTSYYPGSPALDGAEAFALRSGEERAGIDFVLKEREAKCVKFQVIGPVGVGERFVSFEEVTSGLNQSLATSAITGNKKLRVCGLSPGQYRIRAGSVPTAEDPVPAFFGQTSFNIGTEDFKDIVVVDLRPGIHILGETSVDQSLNLNNAPLPEKIPLQLDPVGRLPLAGEATTIQATVPGPFTFPNLLSGVYSFNTRNVQLPAGVYVKSLTYNGADVLHQAFEIGNALGDSIRVVLAGDGGQASIRVVEDNGDPLSDAGVLLIPKDLGTLEQFVREALIDSTDQMGTCQFDHLQPGAYLVFASRQRLEKLPSIMEGLWQTKSKMVKVDVPPRGVASPVLNISAF